MLSKKGQSNSIIGILVGIMVIVVIGVSITIPVIQNQITASTTLGNYEELNINAINGTLTTLTYGDLVSNGQVVTTLNETSGSLSTLVEGTNYTMTDGTQNSKAVITWIDVDGNTALANISYSYYPATYIKSSVVITLLDLIPLFLVLSILIIVVGIIKTR